MKLHVEIEKINKDKIYILRLIWNIIKIIKPETLAIKRTDLKYSQKLNFKSIMNCFFHLKLLHD
jgi:hypothetical protein